MSERLAVLVHTAIKDSLRTVAKLRIDRNSPGALYPEEIFKLLEEMARNASQCVMSIPEIQDGIKHCGGCNSCQGEPNDIRIGSEGVVSQTQGHNAPMVGALEKTDGEKMGLRLSDVLIMIASLQGRTMDEREARMLARRIEDFYGRR